MKTKRNSTELFACCDGIGSRDGDTAASAGTAKCMKKSRISVLVSCKSGQCEAGAAVLVSFLLNSQGGYILDLDTFPSLGKPSFGVVSGITSLLVPHPPQLLIVAETCSRFGDRDGGWSLGRGGRAGES